MNPLMYIQPLLVAVIVSVFCSPEDTYYIQALSNTTCPIRRTCMTLSEFAHQNGTPTKNKTLNFLPGEHTLSSNIFITNINSCSLIGIQNATSRIRCKPGVGFAFSNILYVRIQYLVFISCGAHRIVGMFALSWSQYGKLRLPTPHLRTTLGMHLVLTTVGSR